MEGKIVVGIDPGTNVLGFSVVKQVGSNIELMEMGVVNMRKFKTHQDKLLHIFQSVAKIILKYRPAEMAVEAPFYGKNPQSMLKLGRAQGVAIAAALTREIKVFEYAPKKIKLSITGSGNASKEQVAAMLKHLVIGDTDHAFLDASDALATAVCHCYQNKLDAGPSNFTDWSAYIKENPGKVKS